MIKMARIRNVEMPRRAYPTDAGIDFFMPIIDEAFVHDFGLLEVNESPYHPKVGDASLWMAPRSQALIPSGIVYELPPGTALFQFDKSGVSTRNLLKVLACVADEGYQGELKLSVYNLSDRGVFLKVGDPIVQFVHLDVRHDDVQEVELEALLSQTTCRGAGGFGSTSGA